MSIVRGLFIALSMYSKIPVPQVKWDKKSMKLAFCFLPLIGVVIGVVELFWNWIAVFVHMGSLLYAAIATAIPLLITGGIHLDGFMDTADAHCSYGDTAKKLKILDDPHIGAFGAMRGFLFLLLQFGLFAELYQKGYSIWPVIVGYVCSRAVGGFLATSLKNAKQTGLIHTFSMSAQQRAVQIVCAIWLATGLTSCLFVQWQTGLLFLAGMVVVLFFWFLGCYREFQGITGDLAGCLVQRLELMALVISVLSGYLMGGLL